MDPRKARGLLRDFPFLSSPGCLPNPHLDSRGLAADFHDIRVFVLDSDVLGRTTWWDSSCSPGWRQNHGAKPGERFYNLVMRGQFTYQAKGQDGKTHIGVNEFLFFDLSRYSSSGQRPLIKSLGALIRNESEDHEFRSARPVALLEYTGGYRNRYSLAIYKWNLEGFEELVQAATASRQGEPEFTCDLFTRRWPPHLSS